MEQVVVMEVLVIKAQTDQIQYLQQSHQQVAVQAEVQMILLVLKETEILVVQAAVKEDTALQQVQEILHQLIHLKVIQEVQAELQVLLIT